MVIDTESDRLQERKNPAKNESEKYTYDAVGNMIRRELMNTATGKVLSRTEYIYNYQDQLTTVSQNGQVIAEYGYDASRRQKRVNIPTSSLKHIFWSYCHPKIDSGV